jgi:hypothetical protein
VIDAPLDPRVLPGSTATAVTIMGGLAFASILTLIAVPTLDAILFRIHEKPPEPAGGPVPA